MIEIEPVNAPPSFTPRRRRMVVTAVALLALVASGLVVFGPDGGSGGKVALRAGSSPTGAPEQRSVQAPAAAGSLPADDGWSSPPWPGGEVRYELAGPLPDLPGHAAAWSAVDQPIDRAGMMRIAAALDVSGTPVRRDGAWIVEGPGWTLGAFPGPDATRVSFSRAAFAGDDLGTPVTTTVPPIEGPPGPTISDGNARKPVPATVPAAVDPPGPAVSKADAMARVQVLLDRMKAPGGPFGLTATETEVGVSWGCAEAVPFPRPDPDAPTSARDLPLPAIAACPAPPPPTRGWSVSAFPNLGGLQADGTAWSATLRSDGRVESLFGSWARYERARDYTLVGVEAAFEDLRSGRPGPVAYDSGFGMVPPPVPGVVAGAEPAPPTVPALAPPLPIHPSLAPACPPGMAPLPDDPKRLSPPCVPLPPAEAMTITVTGAAAALQPWPVFEGGRTRFLLLPAYRFLGRDAGGPWQTTVLALRPSDIPAGPPTTTAPPRPPDTAVSSDGFVGKETTVSNP